MKNRILNRSFMLLALLGVLFTSCKKDHYDEPPIQDLPIGQVYTIDQILALESGFVFNEDASVYGTITADEVSGNLYKAAFMQDPETGKAIELYLNATSGVRIGDRVRIYLKGVTYALYNGLPQLSNFEPDGHIIIEANNQPIEPLETSISEICSGSIAPGSLVKLKHVKFTEKNTFADPTTYGNRTLVDSADYTKQVTVRTSNYANFANDSLPQGNGEMIAIASIYNSTWQLLIRSARELKFDGYHPTGELPYYQDFASSFGSYSTYDVLGEQKWIIDYETAKMTGYVGNTNYANEDWLISSRFSLENISAACVTMTYVARFFSNINNDITILVSSDYISGNDPNSASWTSVPFAWSESQDWYTFATTTADLSQFVGQKVNLAVRYLSTDVKAGTLEIKSILIQEGSGPTPPPGPTPGGEVQAMPYTQDFSSAMGTYGAYSVLGAEEWVIDHFTAKMSGYSGSSHANEDWLYSSPVAITGVNHAKVAVNYVAQYQTNLANDVTLQVSSDYIYGSDPTTATWTQMSVSYPNTSNWNDFKTIETSLDEFIGRTVTIAIKYISDDSQSRTFEVKTITVEEGEAGGGGGQTIVGDGSRTNPYLANDILLLNTMESDGNKYWVKGYVVGTIDSENQYTYVFSASTSVYSNIILSSDVNTTSQDACIPIQLPVGAVRTGLNLADNSGNYLQEVLLYGTLEKYFNLPGVKNVSYAEINGNSFGTEPGGGGGVGIEYFNQTLTSQNSFNTFSSYSVTGEQEWYFNTSNPTYGAVMSGFQNNVSYENEDWFISPAIDLSNSTNPVLVFDHARGPESSINIGVEEGYYTVWVTNDYTTGEDPTGERWTELTGVAQPTIKWDFVSSGNLSIPAEYRTANCRIAFRYLSADGASATWEIKNVIVMEP